jgi:hypothetical protein
MTLADLILTGDRAAFDRLVDRGELGSDRLPAVPGVDQW